MLVLILNMPIIDYKKNINGQVINENVSIITYLKRWQPLVDIEGELSAVDITDINEETQKDNDGLDLPQIIEGQYTVLFLGFDESSEMNDVNWLFQFNIGNGTMNVLQIPRDSFMPYYTSSFTGKFNSIYSSGDGEVSPIQRVVNAVQDNFGIPIDAYVTTNCYDIVSIVDLIGGIPMTLEEEMMYEGDKIIPAGYNVLTGEQAEWFVRYRRTFKGEGDIARMKNQRKFLAAAMKKMLNIVEDEGKTKFYGYLKKIYDNRYILTDMSLEEISMLADFGSTLNLEQVQVHLVPGEGAWYYPEGHDKQSVWSVHKQETLDLINANFRPYQIALTPERSAIVELVTDHLTDFNDNSSDNLEDIDNGNTNTPSIDSY
jgi:LCP family protein required for cell wall assembly